MTRYSVFLTALLLVLLAGWQTTKTLYVSTHYVFTDESTLWVTGTSTVHDWKCDIKEVDGWVDTDLSEMPTAILNAEVTVQADGLECKNGTMNKKALKALAADDHPIIRYTLKAADLTPADKGFSATTTGSLTIAGETRTVTATVRGRVGADGALRVSTEVPITMSDHGIDPPTAMLGALKTGDKVVVHFEGVAAPVEGM